MAKTSCNSNGARVTSPAAMVTPVPRASPLHRLGEVRRQENISRRTIARRLGISVAVARRQEQATTDLLLSVLYKWREVLDVPLIELLEEPKESLSSPIQKRSELLRLMKTAAAIRDHAQEPAIRRMGQTLVDQLIDMIPELRDVGSWHVVGQRRRRDEHGRIAELILPESIFLE
jgi:transcriptional regulator with XRE-family HTH domain